MLNINDNNKYLDYPDQEVPRVWNDKVPKGSYERWQERWLEMDQGSYERWLRMDQALAQTYLLLSIKLSLYNMCIFCIFFILFHAVIFIFILVWFV